MKHFLRYTTLTFISFIFFFEILSLPSFQNNYLRPDPVEISSQDKDQRPKAFLIGDSYANTSYLKRGFPVIFRSYFSQKGYSFQDLSSSASEMDTHLGQFRDLKDIHPEVVIYFYNINDIISLDKSLFGGVDQDEIRINKEGADNDNVTKSSPSAFNVLSFIRMYSASFILIKDIMHWGFDKVTARPTPGSTVYDLPQSHVKYKNELSSYFNEFSNYTDRLIIVVNTPMNFGDHPKRWKHYKVLNDFNLPPNTTLIHAIDHIGDASYALSWRNGHYNQKGVDKLGNDIIRRLNK